MPDKKDSKQSPLLIVFAALSILLLVLFLWAFSGRQALQKEDERHQSNIYLSVMYRLDNLYRLYDDLSRLVSDRAQAPDDVELRARLTGVLEGITIESQNTIWPTSFKIYTEVYSNRDLELSGTVRDHMQAVKLSLLFTDEEIDVFSAMPAEDLNAVAELYRQLSQCFYRADGNFGDLFMAREFYNEEFSASLQRIDDLLLQLEEYTGYETD